MLEVPVSAATDEFLEAERRREGIKVRRRFSEKRFLKELRDLGRFSLFVTDEGFAGNYLGNRVGSAVRIRSESVEEVTRCKLEFFRARALSVVGFGGGRPIDVAKKTAWDLGKKLITVPTAPSHNGIASPTASLLEDGRKKSFRCGYPRKIIIPVFLWKAAERHVVSGILDVLGSVTAIADVLLSARVTGERPRPRDLSLSLRGVEKVAEMKGLEDLEDAIISHGLAMKEDSRYCSGSEHEVEKCLSKRFDYFHGELVGVGTLLSAYLYRDLGSGFGEGKIFDWLLEVYRRRKVDRAVRKVLSEVSPKLGNLGPELKAVRPERFTLWNYLDPEKIDFRKISREIESVL